MKFHVTIFKLKTALKSIPDLQLVLQLPGDVVHGVHDFLCVVAHLHVVGPEPRGPELETAVVGVDERLDVAAPLYKNGKKGWPYVA